MVKISTAKVKGKGKGKAKAKAVALAFVAAAAMLALFSGGAAVAAGNDSWSETLVVASFGDVRTLDPAVSYDVASGLIVANTYERLVESTVQKKGNKVQYGVVPGLARSWDVSADGKTYTFHLRPEARFSDGGPVTATAVKYSFERVLKMKQAPSGVLSEYISPSGIIVVDDHTVQIRLDKPFSAFLQVLGFEVASIVNPKAVEGHGGIAAGAPNDWMSRNVAGSGPYVVESWKPGDELVLKANGNYWGRDSKMQRVIIKVIKEPSTQLMLLTTGQVDMALGTNPKDIQTLKKQKGISVATSPGTTINYISMNNQIKPFDNVLVRQALSYALDVEEIVDRILYGNAEQLKTPIPEGVLGHEPGYWHYDYNLQKAKDLLAKAGYASGFKTKVVYNSGNAAKQQIAVFMQDAFKKLGVDVELQEVSFPTYLEMGMKGQAPLYIMGWPPDFVDPDNYISPLLTSAAWEAGANVGRYKNTEVDKLADGAKEESDPAKREKLYERIQEVVVQDAPWIFLYQSANNVPMRDWVKGYKAGPTEGVINFAELSKER